MLDMYRDISIPRSCLIWLKSKSMISTNFFLFLWTKVDPFGPPVLTTKSAISSFKPNVFENTESTKYLEYENDELID
jgi:hypothetical protein